MVEMRTVIILSIGFLTAFYGLIFNLPHNRLKKYLIIIHIAFLLLTVFAIALASKDWGFRGAYTERIIASIWFGSGIALYGFYGRNIPKNIYKLYFGIYFWFLPILFTASFIPRLKFMSVVIGLGLFLDKEYKVYPIDNTYKLQKQAQGVLHGAPILGLVENKYFIFEKVNNHFLKKNERFEEIEPKRISTDSVRIKLIPYDIEYSKIIDTTIYLPLQK